MSEATGAVTLTLIADETPTFPAASYAFVWRTCVPDSDVESMNEYGDVASVDASALSTQSSTFATPRSSLALADTVDPAATVAPFDGAVIDVTGGCVSGAAFATVTVTTGDRPTWLAASYARATSPCEPFESVVVSNANPNGSSPSVPTTWPSTSSSTPVTATLSVAVTSTAATPLIVAPPAGEVIRAVGASVSGGAVHCVSDTLSNTDESSPTAPTVRLHASAVPRRYSYRDSEYAVHVLDPAG